MTDTPRWSCAAATHRGKVRKVNEDAYLSRPEIGLWAVADGMGGHHAGDVASRTVVEQLAEVRGRGRLSELVDEVEDRLSTANRLLREMAAQRHPPTVMGSTVAVLLAHGYHCLSLWSGDSRIYRLRAGSLEQITRDHSQVQQWVDQGILPAAEAERHPASNIITRAVGADVQLWLDMELRALQEEERYLICSDGLYREVPAAELAQRLARGSCAQACESLVEAALTHGARDNLTLVVIHFNSHA